MTLLTKLATKKTIYPFLIGLTLLSCSRQKSDRIFIQNKGSDTLINLAQGWAEEYQKTHPQVAIAVSSGGTGTGIAALINGTVDIANASREMTTEEMEQAKKNTGKNVNVHTIALDALITFVHPSNPLTGLTMDELKCIYSEEGNCETWDQIRNTVVPGCEGNKIIRVSRQSNSGTYQYFREVVAGDKKNLKLGSLDMNGSREGADLVSKTPCAIGYSGLAYGTPTTKTLCLHSTTEQCVSPSKETALNKTYPLSRGLYMLTLGEESAPIKEYLTWTQSEAGRAITEKIGFVPVAKE